MADVNLTTQEFATLENLGYFKQKHNVEIDAKDAKVLQDAKDYFDNQKDDFDPAGAAVTEAGKVQTKLDEEVERAQGAEKALSDKIGEVPADKTVAQMIEEAKTAATYNDAEVKAGIQENKEAIALLNDGAEVAGSVDYKIAQAVASILDNPDETMNSINELVTWCNDHADDALELSNKVSANEQDILALEGLVGEVGVAKQIEDAIAGALKIEGVDKYALATDLTNAIARIAALEGKAHEHANKTVLDGISAEKVTAWDSAEQNAKTYADGLNTTMDGRVTPLEADMTQAKKDIDAVEAAVATKVETEAYNTKVAALEGEDTAIKGRLTTLETAIGEGGYVGTQIDAKIGELDAEVTSAEVVEGKGLRVKVTETDGKVDGVVVTGNFDESYDTKGASAQALVDAKAYADGKDTAIAEAKKAGTDAASAVTTLENGAVKTNTDNIATNTQAIADIQAAMPKALTNAQIDTLFAEATA